MRCPDGQILDRSDRRATTCLQATRAATRRAAARITTGAYRAMALEDHELKPATVLRGHVSQDTAYLVPDYPYGYSERCQIRYWLHTATKGSAAGKVRLMSQTTNPKRPGQPWNKPKPSTYARWAVLIEDSRGHVTWWAVNDWGPRPCDDLLMRVRTIYDQLDEQERAGYQRLLDLSITRSHRDEWERIKQAYEHVGAGLACDQLLDRHGIYLDERTHDVLVAAWADELELWF